MFGTNKPFGTASTFGASTFGTTSTPFGQTTNTFGAKPSGTGNVFGSSTFGVSTPSAPISGGLFGSSTPAASNSLFGQPTTAFGAPASTSTGGFGFGATSTSGGLFGATTPATQSSGGLFGNTSTSAFGSPRPAFGGFGTATSTGSGLFGQTTNTGTSLFGSSTGFAGAATPNGTTIKFNPPSGTDTMMKGGVSTNISTRHQCITCMKEYENKSLEELRTEDYAANRKGGGASVGMGFGAAQPQANLFGAPTATATSAFSFGGTTQTKPMFGGATGQTNTFGSGNLFGQPAQNQNAGLFGKSVGFGAPASSAAPVFNFGASTGSSLFGQTNQQKSLFGQPTSSTGLFGNTATTQSTGFGTSTGFAGFGAANQQSAGLFGAKPTGFSTTNTTASTNTFSFGNTNAMNGGGLFGQKPTTSAFGTGTAFGTPSTGFGAFGATSLPSTNLFGQTKPTASTFGTTGNMFGGLGNTTFGAPSFSMGLGTNTGTGLFGATNTNKAPGFSFGNTGSTGFTFGAPNPGTSAFNFGGTNMGMPLGDPSNSAAIQQAHQQILAMTANPFGDSPLFRNSLKDSSREIEVLKPTNPSAQKTLLKDNHYKIALLPTAKIKPKPWIPAPSGKMLLFDGLEDEEPSLGTAAFLPKKSVKKLVLKNLNNSQSSLTLTSSISPNQSTRIDVSISLNKTANSPEITPRSKPLTIGIGNSDANSTPKVPITSSQPNSSSTSKDSLAEPLAPSIPRVSFNNSMDDSIAALHTNKQTFPKRIYDVWSESDGSGGDLDCEINGTINRNQGDSNTSHPTGITLTLDSYYTIPTLEEMIPFLDSENQNCLVRDFTVGREGYGKVIFPGETNVYGLNIDEIVSFGKKEINVYPDDNKKPPVGEGLNRRATVILENVWPTDKTNHEPIKDPERIKRIGYQEKIERCTAKLGATFVGYKPGTGSWIFEVDHFSKYGLEDSDEDMEVPKQQEKKSNSVVEPMNAKCPSEPQLIPDLKRKPISSFNRQDQEMEVLNASPMMSSPLELIDDEAFMSDITNQVRPIMSSEIEAGRIQGMKASLFDEDMDDENWGSICTARSNTSNTQRKETYNEESMLKAKKMDSFQTNLNKKQKYCDAAYEQSYPLLPESSKLSELGVQNSLSSLSLSTIKLLESFESFPIVKSTLEQSIPPRKMLPVALDNKIYLKPFKQSILYDKQHLLADAGYFMGRTCRVGWSCNGIFIYPKAPEQLNIATENPIDVLKFLFDSPKHAHLYKSSFTVNLTDLTSYSSGLKDAKIIERTIIDALELQLANSVSTQDEDITLFVPKPGVEPIHAHAALFESLLKDADLFSPQADFIRQCVYVWDLLVSLWGKVGGLEEDQSATGYVVQMARREALSSWLIKATEKDNSRMAATIKADNYLMNIFLFLCGRRTADAVKLATQYCDFRLSLLLSQTEANGIVRKLITKQLFNWKENGTYDFIKKSRIMLYALLAGMLVYEDVNCCRDLSWKQALALQLWYHCRPNASVQDAIKQYDEAFQGTGPHEIYASAPNPPYINEADLSDKTEEESPIVFDTCYHLLKLYCDRSHRLDLLLVPETYSSDHLDYRLSWLLHLALSSVGYNIPDGIASSLHINFASQLEALGLWHWAVFVLLHHGDSQWRVKQVKDLLLRHVSLESSLAMVENEKFLTERLEIPEKWIFEAKAIKANNMGKNSEEAWYLLQAGSWSKSHSIVMKYIASDSVISEDYDYLLKYLNELALPERCCTILDWANGGQVYMDYINMCRVVQEVVLRETSAYDLEKFTPEVISLCKRLSSIHTYTLKDRLSVAEMAKKTATILRSILILQASRTNNTGLLTSLSNYIKHLPMPYDYAVPEYRFTAHQFLDEVVQDV